MDREVQTNDKLTIEWSIGVSYFAVGQASAFFSLREFAI